MKKILIFLAKFLIVGGLLYWLFSSGKLDLNAFKEFFKNPLKIIVGILVFFTGILVNTFRWRSLIKQIENQTLGVRKLFQYGWLGLFFNMTLPGTVSGDVIKVMLLKKNSNSLSVKRLLLASFIDRAFGLSALITLMGIISIINYKNLIVSDQIKYMIHLNLLIFTVFITSVVFLFTKRSLKEKVFNLIPHTGLREKIQSLVEMMERIKANFFKYILMSMCSQTLYISIFIYLSGSALSPLKAFTAVPLGFLSLAIPIAPGGMGVGHAMFESIFSAYSIKNGAILFNNYFLLMTVINLTGIIPYLTIGKSASELIEEAESIQ
jgi:hypothetical protein